MSPHAKTNERATKDRKGGFSLLELLGALSILLIISGTVTLGLMKMMQTQGTISNRTEMHSNVRNATELLQQEVSQAGGISLPGTVTLSGAVGSTGSQTVGVSSASGMFTGEQLVIDAGANQETVALTSVNTTSNQITGVFNNTHASGVPVVVQGAFGTGVVSDKLTNGSTSTVLKIYGNINGDGNMVYVEYTCDTTGGNLYRNSMPVTAASKPAVTSAQVLLSNILPNPGGAACFTYQDEQVGSNWYVVDVAITLTVQTQFKDPQTNQYQSETKALLNVSPRNVFCAWELDSIGASSRIQPMPASVTNLLP